MTSTRASRKRVRGATRADQYNTRGLKTGMVDPDGSRTTWVYNEGGRLKNVINPLNDSTEYVYDVHGRMITFIDQRGLETHYQYDSSGRKTSVIEEDSTTTTYAYDGGGCGCSGSGPPNKPTAIKTRMNEHFAYSYDAAGRMTSLAYPGGSRTVTFAYTVDGDNPYGALRKVRDPNFASGWDNNYHFEYKYDASGRQLEERFPDGEKTIMAYDGSMRLQNLKFNASSFITTYTYDTYSRPSVTSNSLGQSVTYNYYTSAGKKGMLEQLTYSSGLISTYDYDALLRLQKFKHDPTSGSNIEKYYTYNADSTIDSIYDGYSVTPGSFTGLRWNYDYDAAHQMTRESRQDMLSGAVDSTVFDQQYSFDEAGNRLTRTGSGTGYEEFDATAGAGYNDLNQLMEYEIDGGRPIEHTYDNGGRLTDKDDGDTIDWTYTWSTDGYMTRAQDNENGTQIRYIYDYRGRRLEREDETASSNGPKRRYYFVGSRPLTERVGNYSIGYSWSDDVYNTRSDGAIVWRRTGGASDRSLLKDHGGNVLAEVNTSGVFTATHEQDTFNRPILSSVGGWVDNSIHSYGNSYDSATGMFHVRGSWLDPNTNLSPMALGSRQEGIGPTGGEDHDGGGGGGEPPERPPASDSCAELRNSGRFPTTGHLDVIMSDIEVPLNTRNCINKSLREFLDPRSNKLLCRSNEEDSSCRAHLQQTNGQAGRRPRTLAWSRIGTPSAPGANTTLCVDNIGSQCHQMDFAWIFVHEAAHRCGMPAEPTWRNGKPGIANGTNWDKSGVPGSSEDGGHTCGEGL